MVRRKELSREAFSTVTSLFLKEFLSMFVIASVNDELVASATLIATKHALLLADCPQLKYYKFKERFATSKRENSSSIR